jgi:hypothetical protein
LQNEAGARCHVVHENPADLKFNGRPTVRGMMEVT